MKKFLNEFWRASLQEAWWLVPVVIVSVLLMHWAAAQTGQVDLAEDMHYLLHLIHSPLYNPCGCGI